MCVYFSFSTGEIKEMKQELCVAAAAAEAAALEVGFSAKRKYGAELEALRAEFNRAVEGQVHHV